MGETEKQYVYRVYDRLMTDLGTDEAAFEAEALRKFRKEPAQMKLLIVVSRLLTGFDAPTATYIYIDRQMRDHGLFQAICRVNRLDGDDKDYGYVVDYKDLFKNIETAVEDYTSGAFHAFDAADVEGLISSRAEKAGEDLMTARDAWFGLLDPVEQPRATTRCWPGSPAPVGGRPIRRPRKRRVGVRRSTSWQRPMPGPSRPWRTILRPRA
jgi:type I restriction enzyme R subunit